MTDETSTALAVRAPDPEPEKLPDPEAVSVPAALLLAAESILSAKPKTSGIAGVFLHAKDRRGRIVGTDGVRMFVASFPVEGKLPSWMPRGIILHGEGLKARLNMIARAVDEEAEVMVTHVKGSYRAQLSDPGESMSFQTAVIDATFPDYDRILDEASFMDLDGEGEAMTRDWQPIGINSGFLKQCGEVAKLLSNGLPKSARDKKGMVVRAFNGDPSKPVVFDFGGWPGAILVVSPVEDLAPSVHKDTAALLAPALRGSLAALRAHATRQLVRAENATDPADKADAEQKAAGFQARIAALIERAPDAVRIEAGKKKPKAEAAEPEPAGAEAEPEPEAESVTGPRVRRRKVNVKQAA